MSNNQSPKNDNNVFQKMTCNPDCTYFPCMECYNWKFDEDGLKRRNDGKQFICGYDDHIITSWYEECPKERDKKEMAKANKNKKFNFNK